MQKHFADRLVEAIKTKGNPICVGLDPRLDKIPEFIRKEAFEASENQGQPLRAAAEALLAFNKGIIDSVAELVPVVKPQVAFYEIFGHEGMRAYEETIDYAHEKGLVTIADVKRNDIGSTAEAYAEAYLGETKVEDESMRVFDADSVTVNGYLGSDGVKPFVKVAANDGKGLFVLVKTSNPSSGELQDMFVYDEVAREKEAKALYEMMGFYVDSWGADEIGESGYSCVGAVVGATYPEQAAKLRKIMPNAFFLVPGYGAQGGGAADVKPCFNEDGLGAVVNSSRGIIFAYQVEGTGYEEKDFGVAAAEACKVMAKDLASVL
ncbi:orotidine-5'-phosphate decarboxylase [Candidatus Peregrinibacteria bacterium]|jgi:orotidine-5'-phosphate decarboxylase|nr:orotidine-5'-phosphate decarboxylase [Candidatus Peregrinibacteria bacterium]MBT4055876.1 orotidine-5'-phosphate decarboxylase [Candidatus Peregrinibacteria bacterium]